MESFCGKLTLFGALVAVLAFCQMADASLTFTSGTTLGALSGAHYANFDNLNSSGLGNGGMTIAFNPNATAITGSASGFYAAPYVTDSLNNNHFENTPNSPSAGPDSTQYITTGSDGAVAGAAVTLNFTSTENYFGILWGSVDAYNTLTFSGGASGVVTLTGAQVIAQEGDLQAGGQSAGGTTYVNITGISFDKVVATSSQYAFEFDNVAYGAVPEASTLFAGALMLLPLGVSAMRIMRKSRMV